MKTLQTQVTKETTAQSARHECFLSKPVLVLNSAWQPIEISSVRETICEVVSEGASFLDPETYCLHDFSSWMELPHIGNAFISMTKSNKLRVPEVIVLKNYSKTPKKIVKLSRKNLLIRDGYRCQYTGRIVTDKSATIDHVIPKHQNGGNTWENLVISSLEVNAKKANRTPKQAGLVLMKKPVKPEWSPVYSKFSVMNIGKGYPESWRKFLPSNWGIDIPQEKNS